MKIIASVLLVSVITLAGRCCANDDDIEQSWASPNHQFVIHHTAAYNPDLPNVRKTEDIYDQKAAYTLTRKSKVIWSVQAPVDESAHDFRCVWDLNSRFAMILDRASRGAVEAYLVSTSSPRRSRSLHLQRMLDQVEVRAGDTDWRKLQKAWFGQWRFSHGHFEGIMGLARAQYYRLHVGLNRWAKRPKLKLIDQKTSAQWDGIFERL